jgi:hypothetical protein
MSGHSRLREYIAGALIAGIGAFAVIEGRTYGIGGLSNMGSGFFPVALGVGMIALGVMMALFPQPAPTGHENLHKISAPDWRAAAAIAAAVALFILLANEAGLAPAIFACVFTAALGTRQTKLREALVLALGVTVFGVLLFAYGLKVPFPIIAGVLY